MAISKKLRFEVFKRDGFACQYCGKHPPDVTLEIDHVQPKSKEGKDDINNLLTACFDCNRGKSNIELKRIPNSLELNREILEERENQYIEYHKILAKIDKRINKELDQIDEVFNQYFTELELSDSFKKNSVKKFIEKLNVFEVKDAMAIACSKFKGKGKQKDSHDRWKWLDEHDLALKYFCGICWNKIKNNGI
jgi:hypothetical protein